MANILLTWELGGGLGHLVNLLPLAKGLSEHGHKVVAVLQDLSKVQNIFGDINVQYLQAPIINHPPSRSFNPIRTFAHLLFNNGFNDVVELKTMTKAWRNIYDYVQPDLIVFDHSPTALLAARGHNVKKALIGTGFFCPRDQYPLADLRPWLGDASEKIWQEEDMVLGLANQLLKDLGQGPLNRLAQLYREVDENFLVTFAELDNYGLRQNARYWGAWSQIGGKTPKWPEGQGKRIYAYFKSFPALPQFLAHLKNLGYPTIIYGSGIDTNIVRQFESNMLHFESEPLDMAQIGRQCDLAILNGNHGSTVSMLLAGRPMLQIPLFLEQALNSKAVERLGAGLMVNQDRPDVFPDKLNELLTSQKYAEAAERFANMYADYDPQRQIEEIVQHIEKLLTNH